MKPKEQENQLRFDLNFRIIFSVFVWLSLAGAVAFRLWSLRAVPPISLVSTVAVPSLKQDNITTLRSSIKAPADAGILPNVRPEPFD
ncbi:hypothetical protein HYS10_00325 [Candidatus Collierbacteria bacterium]|nr:hypothetical protein [Candidatus Collierbacteria bacterium]